MKKRVVIYVRVSTEEQAKHGYSIGAQIEALEAFCKSQGWEVVHVYVEDGYSAKDLNRPTFKQMMGQIEKGGVDVLLVYRLDRLTRSVIDLYEILKVLDQHNCAFKSATEVYDTGSAMGRLFITLVAAIAQWERENLGERVRFGISKKAREGKFVGGISAYGYDYINDELVINEQEAKVVREIFDMATYTSPLNIAKTLTKKGYPTKRGGEWNRDTIRNMLINPVYAGYIQINQEKRKHKTREDELHMYDHRYDRIIDRIKFWEMQEILANREWVGTKETTNNYYFTGILRCAQCGHLYTTHMRRGKKGYRCSGKKQGKTCNSHTFYEHVLVEQLFKSIDTMNHITVDSEVKAKEIEISVSQIEAQLEKLSKRKEKVKTMYELEDLTIDEYKERMNNIKELELELYNQLSLMDRGGQAEELNYLKENYLSIWEEADDNQRKRLINKLFRAITIDTEAINGKENRIIIKSII